MIHYCDWTASGKQLKCVENYIFKEVSPFYANTHTTTSITGIYKSYQMYPLIYIFVFHSFSFLFSNPKQANSKQNHINFLKKQAFKQVTTDTKQEVLY